METKLLDCPFCGAAPEIEQEGEFEDVACYNTACLVQPRALGVDGRPSRETWNTRVEAPAYVVELHPDATRLTEEELQQLSNAFRVD